MKTCGHSSHNANNNWVFRSPSAEELNGGNFHPQNILKFEKFVTRMFCRTADVQRTFWPVYQHQTLTWSLVPVMVVQHFFGWHEINLRRLRNSTEQPPFRFSTNTTSFDDPFSYSWIQIWQVEMIGFLCHHNNEKLFRLHELRILWWPCYVT